MSVVFDTVPKLRDKPHMMFTVIHDHPVDENSDNSVIRGEIIGAVTVMRSRMRETEECECETEFKEHERECEAKFKFREHDLFPVCLPFFRNQSLGERLKINHK